MSSKENKEKTFGELLSAKFREDPEIQKSLTPEEKNAVQQLLQNVGTPDEYSSNAEYIFRALPFVKAVYYNAQESVMPAMPSEEELRVMMRSRFLFEGSSN